MLNINIKKPFSISILMASVLILSLMSYGNVMAASPTISHSYDVKNSIPNGSLVSVDSSNSDYVTPSNTSNGAQLIGITLSANQSLLAINSVSSQTEVATSGTLSTLVSTLNGKISSGNQISVSAISGVGMKALPGSHVIGIADASFDSNSSNVVTTQTIKDSSGKTHVIKIGYIPVTIAISIAPIKSSVNSSLNGLQKLVQSLTGHVIPTARIVLAAVIAAITFALLVTLVYGSIYGSIISIGRNPLAKFVIMRSLFSVLAMAGLTAIISGLIIFFLLR